MGVFLQLRFIFYSFLVQNPVRYVKQLVKITSLDLGSYVEATDLVLGVIKLQVV